MLTLLTNLFNTLLYFPLFNLLVVLYNFLPGNDFGLAIIVLTIIIRFILYPLSAKALKSQKRLQNLQPEIAKIQAKYKTDKQKQAMETLALYKKEKINPFGGVFLAFVQLPVLIALYLVFWRGLQDGSLSNLYSFVANPGVIEPLFFGIVNLSQPNILLAVLAGAVQFFQTKMLQSPKNAVDFGSRHKGETGKKEITASIIMQKQMTYFFPFITVAILFTLPSALGLYWTVSGLFSIAQQYFILRKNKID